MSLLLLSQLEPHLLGTYSLLGYTQLLVQLLEREPDNLEASHVLAMVLSGHRLIS